MWTRMGRLSTWHTGTETMYKNYINIEQSICVCACLRARECKCKLYRNTIKLKIQKSNIAVPVEIP